MKLYRAVDKIDGQDSAFLVHDNGNVSVSGWIYPAEEELALAKDMGHFFMQDGSLRFEDAIEPILIAEW